jgi:hypothetical protein
MESFKIRLPDDYKIVAKCTPEGQTVKQTLYRYPQIAKVPCGAGRAYWRGKMINLIKKFSYNPVFHTLFIHQWRLKIS